MLIAYLRGLSWLAAIADDVGVAAFNVFTALKDFLQAWQIAGSAAGLRIHFKKSILVPLGKFPNQSLPL